VAHFTVELGVGPERAVAATKSYTAQLLHVALLVSGLTGEPIKGLASLEAQAREALAVEEALAGAMDDLRRAGGLLTVGRGMSLGTAREAALKVMETSYLPSQAYSSAELMHGPLAMVHESMPTLAFLPEGPAGALVASILPAVAETGSPVWAFTSRSEELRGIAGSIAVPRASAEELAPILEILPVQQLALRLAVAAGHDPDRPRRLAKITRTT
jgi:glucosamine--fructose-6-phosphate aminotransferase (isomerizing)